MCLKYYFDMVKPEALSVTGCAFKWYVVYILAFLVFVV